MLLLHGKAKSRKPGDSVKAVEDLLFGAMNNSDQALLLSCFSGSALLQTIAKNKEGNLFVKNESIKEFAASSDSAPKCAPDARISLIS